MSTVTKFFACEKTEINEDERSVVAYVTTETLDRDGEVVLAGGADLANYRKNPIILWGHDYHATPIAKTVWIRQDNKGLLAKLVYATTQKAEEIWQLRKGGFLKGYSIGFIPKQGKTADGLPAYGPPHEKEIAANPAWKQARNLVRAFELLEISDVPVPCNPDALGRAYASKSLTISPELASQLAIKMPEPTPEQPPKYRVYSPDEFLEWCFRDHAAREVACAQALREAIATEVPKIVEDVLHVARGGV